MQHDLRYCRAGHGCSRRVHIEIVAQTRIFALVVLRRDPLGTDLCFFLFFYEHGGAILTFENWKRYINGT